MHLEAACSSTQGHSVTKNALFPTQKYYYEPFFGGHLMEWFSDRLFLDFGIEFLSISSLWIFVDMGLIMGSNLFFSLRKIPFWKNNFENKFQNTNFKISNSRIQKKKQKNVSKDFWSIRKKDCDTESAAWFSLVTVLSPETHRPGVSALPLGTASRFWLDFPHFWVWSSSPRDSRGHSLCDLCFHSKTLFSSRPITDSTNTLDFTSV